VLHLVPPEEIEVAGVLRERLLPVRFRRPPPLKKGNSPYCSRFRYVSNPEKFFGLFSFIGGWTFARVTIIV